MDKYKVDIIDCDGFQIAATIETEDQEQHSIYYPANCLIYVQRGCLQLHTSGDAYTIKQGEFALVRKYTQGVYLKTAPSKTVTFLEHIFVLNDVFIQEVIGQFEIPENLLPCSVPVVKFSNSPILLGLMSSIEAYITGQAQLDTKLIHLKTKEALLVMTQHDPSLISIFKEFSSPQKADLIAFMEGNFYRNLSLEQFAQMSGRSLSTFNRDFRKCFNKPPYKWIKHRRLAMAGQLLVETRYPVTKICFDTGFQDMAHFSRSFKSHFGATPSEVRQNGIPSSPPQQQ